MNDPLVRQVVDLFDARLVDLRSQPAPPQPTDSDSEGDGPQAPDDPESGAEP